MPDSVKQPNSVLVVEDNTLLAFEIFEILRAADFEPLGPCSTYTETLESLYDVVPEFCVLDLDLGIPPDLGLPPGAEGRKILSVLNSKGIKTVVYSAYCSIQTNLRALHQTMEMVDKAEPTERVVDAMRKLQAAE